MPSIEAGIFPRTRITVKRAIVTAAVLMTRWRRLAWLAVPYALHVLMDIPTHERYQTQPLYPLSSWSVQGVSWADPRIFSAARGRAGGRVGDRVVGAENPRNR